jgi:aminoacyl tRNA synthase complex-interacting multifunctional protein 1
VTEKKKKEKAPATTATAHASTSTSTSGALGAVQEAGKKVKEAVGGKKEKKEKAAKAEGGKAAAPPAKEAEGSGEPVPSMIDLRVGQIVHSASPSFLRPMFSEKRRLMGSNS